MVTAGGVNRPAANTGQRLTDERRSGRWNADIHLLTGEGQPIAPADQLDLLIGRIAKLPETASAELVQSVEKLEKKHPGVSGDATYLASSRCCKLQKNNNNDREN